MALKAIILGTFVSVMYFKYPLLEISNLKNGLIKDLELSMWDNSKLPAVYKLDF